MFMLRPYCSFFPQISPTAYIDPSAQLIGNIHIGDDSSVWPLVAARGDVNKIVIGARSNIQDGAVLHVTRTEGNPPNGWPLLIGDDVTVGHKAMLHGCTA